MVAKLCRECKNDVAEDAARCPHCGAISPALATNQRSWMTAALAPIVLVLITVCGSLAAGPMGAAVGGAAAFIALFAILRRKY